MAERAEHVVEAMLGEREERLAAPLLAALAAAGVTVEVGGRARPGSVVLYAASRPPSAAETDRLLRHLKAGGGVVALGDALAWWAREPSLATVAGWAPAAPAPEAELRLTPAVGTAFAERLDPELLFRDRLLLGPPAPAQAEVLLTVPWHYGTHVAAFTTPAAGGRLVYLGLGGRDGAWSEPEFARLVARAVREAAGLATRPAVGVGLYGYGAIGREHATAVASVSGFELAAIADRSPGRRDQASADFGVPVHADGSALLADPAVDLVVVGVPPVAHHAAVMEALAAGKHVVCEKPFALRAAECDEMIETAERAGVTLTVYQSRRWDPDFVALRAAVEAGAIGDLFYMESFIGGFGHPCSYWHSHEPVSGGTIYDWGSHYFDWLLTLVPDEVVSVAANSQKRVWHDVTNADHVRVDVTFAGGRQATFLQSDIAAALKPKWYLLGTDGAITGDWRLESVKSRAWTGDLVEERLSPAESPAIVTVWRPDGSGGAHREELSLRPRVPGGFYRNLGDHIHLGEPLAVTPAQARRNVAVMEAAARSIAAGAPIAVKA